MMGPRQVAQGALYYEFSIEDHVPNDRFLRGIDRFVDLGDLRQHLARIRVRQRDLPIGCIFKRAFHPPQSLYLPLDTRIAPTEIVDLLRPRLTFFVTVNADHLVDVALDAGFEMHEPAGDLAFREIPVVRPTHSNRRRSWPHC